MDEDRKLVALKALFDLALTPGVEHIHMWLIIPGGLLQGRPITPEEYVSLLTGDNTIAEKVANSQQEQEAKQKRFFHLKDVDFVQGETHHLFNVTILDGLEVSAWGFYDPTTSRRWSESIPKL